ncbi:MAG TPA: helix-hairpin-helix domain-containing protein [Acidimicrobiales bacterium]|nr:helix-hairpin-helix domain-containing protein [Acidimicrobiales bacterium]
MPQPRPSPLEERRLPGVDDDDPGPGRPDGHPVADGRDGAAGEVPAPGPPRDVLAGLRPLPPRSWRDRAEDLLAEPPSLGRVVAALAVVVVAGVVAWRLLAPPPGPPEAGLPQAQPVAVDTTAVGGTGGPPASAAGPPGAVAGPGAGGAGGPAGSVASEVVVHVVGAVASPGVQRLRSGARVVDAIDAAGGAVAEADLARVNLAAVLVDGQQVVVPRPGDALPVAAGVPAPAGGPGSGPGTAPGGPLVNLNTAGAAELEELPGVGPATAEAIIAHRQEVGPFAAVDDLLDVRGIGEAKLEQIRPRATV